MIPEPRDLGDGDTAAARTALLAALDAPVTEPTAYVLPLHRLPDDAGWASADWRLRRGRIVLSPGDSPAGLRLPLDSVAWDPEPAEPDADPLAADRAARATPPCPIRASRWWCRPPTPRPPRWSSRSATASSTSSCRRWSASPTSSSWSAVVEQAAAVTGTPLVVEGYGPPGDAALQTLTVTPDPGVIEVNVQPTRTWAEQSELAFTLYEAARQSRLGTETFAVDGTHAGTGGGNHITLGGVTPAESPLLRRPDLLVSLLTYWQRHPSLSYLFSGRFIGPTSQAPRVDEGRAESLYELEIAFAEIDRLTGKPPTATAEDTAPDTGSTAGAASPWVVDRALRHLLTDVTGNTHRSEFCIDKLYSPDSARGRLGLLELRGFEMPPHPQMGLVQALLVRALVARFWAEPAAGAAGPARTGPARALPAAALRRPPTSPRWPPICAPTASTSGPAGWIRSWSSASRGWAARLSPGSASSCASAIEPWHVLGEEATAGGTARYVDSSVERMQVLLDGADPARHLLTVNGVPVPLTPTGAAGLHVAGIRYRAWQPWSALHPTIPVQSPLVFDLVDVDRRGQPGRLHLPRGAPRRPVLRRAAGERDGGGVPPDQPVRGHRVQRRARSTCRGCGSTRPGSRATSGCRSPGPAARAGADDAGTGPHPVTDRPCSAAPSTTTAAAPAPPAALTGAYAGARTAPEVSTRWSATTVSAVPGRRSRPASTPSGAAGLDRLRGQVERLLDDDGVTYTPIGGARTEARPAAPAQRGEPGAGRPDGRAPMRRPASAGSSTRCRGCSTPPSGRACRRRCGSGRPCWTSSSPTSTGRGR